MPCRGVRWRGWSVARDGDKGKPLCTRIIAHLVFMHHTWYTIARAQHRGSRSTADKRMIATIFCPFLRTAMTCMPMQPHGGSLYITDHNKTHRVAHTPAYSTVVTLSIKEHAIMQMHLHAAPPPSGPHSLAHLPRARRVFAH